MRAGVFGTAALSLCFLLAAAASGHAQSPPPSAPAPLPGFVPPYEITKIVRTAGFDPLAPPRREGTTYVLRATDFRGILMRVVVDARSGAIRAVNRIVPGPGSYGPAGMMAGPYGPPPLYYGGPPPYGMLPAYGPPGYGRSGNGPGRSRFGPGNGTADRTAGAAAAGCPIQHVSACRRAARAKRARRANVAAIAAAAACGAGVARGSAGREAD